MTEYTLFSTASVAVVVTIDLFVLRTRLVTQWRYWVFFGVMVVFTLIANGYLTWRPIVLYGEEQYLGIRLGTIPLEDFLFGFSLISTTIMCWEYLGVKGSVQATSSRKALRNTVS